MFNKVWSFGCSHTYGDELEQELLYDDDIDGHFKKALGRKKIPSRLYNGQFDFDEVQPGDRSKWKEYMKKTSGWETIETVCKSNSFAGQVAKHFDCEYQSFSKPGNSNTSMYADFVLKKHLIKKDDLVIIAYTGPQRTTQFTLDGKTHTRVNTPVPGMKKDYLDGLTEYVLLHSEYGDDMLSTLLNTYALIWQMQGVCVGRGAKVIIIDILDRYVHPPMVNRSSSWKTHQHLLRIYETMKNFDLQNKLPADFSDFNGWWALVEKLQRDYTDLTDTEMGLDIFTKTLENNENITETKNAWGHCKHFVHTRYVQDVVLPTLERKYDISI